MAAGWVYDCLQCSALLMLKFPHSGLIYLAVRPDLGETEEWALFTLLPFRGKFVSNGVFSLFTTLRSQQGVAWRIEYFPN